MTKKWAKSQGVVGGANLSTVSQREIFFPMDPATMEFYAADSTDSLSSSGLWADVNLEEFLPFLPEMEQEIVYMLHIKEKGQADVAKILNVSQPTVSYRYRRALQKLAYILVLASTPYKETIWSIPDISEEEKCILVKLAEVLNQNMAGSDFRRSQSSVRWLLTKTLEKLRKLEQMEPELWFKPLVTLLLVERSLQLRIKA